MLRRAKFLKKIFTPLTNKKNRLGQLFLFPPFKIQNFVCSENARELEDTKVVFFI